MNGSATIHDYEIAVAGHSSEDVEAVLPDGSFGSAEETGRDLNDVLNEEFGSGGMSVAVLSVCSGRQRKPNPFPLRQPDGAMPQGAC